MCIAIVQANEGGGGGVELPRQILQQFLVQWTLPHGSLQQEVWKG